MSFNLKEYLTENKLTPTSRLSRVRRPGGSYLLQEGGIRDLYRSEDDEVYNNMRQALGRERPNFRYEEGPGVKDLEGLKKELLTALDSHRQATGVGNSGNPRIYFEGGDVYVVKDWPWEGQNVSCKIRVTKEREPDLQIHWYRPLEIELFDIKTQVKKNLD